MSNEEMVAHDVVAEPMVQTAERMIPMSQVNEIVKNRMAAATEKARMESMQQMQMQQGSMPQQPMQQPPMQMQQGMQQGMTPDMQRMVDDRIVQQSQAARAEYERQMMQQEAQRVANEFMQKLHAGKSKYDDFDSVVDVQELGNFPDIVRLAHSVDNTADVIYELMKNPSKIGNLAYLSSKGGRLAETEIRRLAESIKNNEAAGNQRLASEPLTQIKTSNAGQDNGRMSIRDLRKLPSLRG